jgi:hypothetical protein
MLPGGHRPFAADVDPACDGVVVGACQHEQGSGEQVVAGVDTSRPCAHHDAGLLGEQVTTTGCERP